MNDDDDFDDDGNANFEGLGEPTDADYAADGELDAD